MGKNSIYKLSDNKEVLIARNSKIFWKILTAHCLLRQRTRYMTKCDNNAKFETNLSNRTN